MGPRSVLGWSQRRGHRNEPPPLSLASRTARTVKRAVGRWTHTSAKCQRPHRRNDLHVSGPWCRRRLECVQSDHRSASTLMPTVAFRSRPDILPDCRYPSDVSTRVRSIRNEKKKKENAIEASVSVLGATSLDTERGDVIWIGLGRAFALNGSRRRPTRMTQHGSRSQA